MQVDENMLVSKLKKRDKYAVDDLIDMFGGLIKSIVMHQLSSFQRYQDECINDILLAVWQNINKFDSDKNSLKNWIGAISRHKCIDYKRKYYKELFSKELDESITDTHSVDENLFKQEFYDEIDSLLSCLSENDKMLFYEYYLGDKSTFELANEFSMKPSAVYNRISRSKKRISQQVRTIKE